MLFVIDKTNFKLAKLYLMYLISKDEDMYTKAVGGQSTKIRQAVTICYMQSFSRSMFSYKPAVCEIDPQQG